jgi:alanyl-tRNA synthetase
MTELAYLTDPLVSDFSADVIKKEVLATGQVDVWLDKTYFYPTGGGQEHDTGYLNDVEVMDVFKDKAGHIVHRLRGDLHTTTVTGGINMARRQGHMQHHSAQHILSAAFFETVGLNTLSAKISADTPSTIDIPNTGLLSDNEIAQAEQLANSIIFEDRPIKTYFIKEADAQTIPFRRPPKVSGQIRVVEVSGLDYSACGGTHCPTAGMIGCIKVVKTERQNQKLRIYFVAGSQALGHFQRTHHTITQIGNILSAGPQELAVLVEQQAVTVKRLQKEIRSYRQMLLPLEAEQLLKQAVPAGSVHLITAMFHGRPAEEIRELGILLKKNLNTVAFLASNLNNTKLSLVVTCSDELPLNATHLLRQQLAVIDGRGGGDANIAQGGGPIVSKQAETFFNNTVHLVTNSGT